mgnify:CR=1 FL=1
MRITEFSINNPMNQWKRFCELLWFNKELDIWLDISRMKINSTDLNSLEPKIEEALKSLKLKDQDIILITGSLYLVGEVLNLN